MPSKFPARLLSLITVLVLCCSSVTMMVACSNSQSSTSTDARPLFAIISSNYAWEYHCEVSVVNSDGSVKNLDISDEERKGEYDLDLLEHVNKDGSPAGNYPDTPRAWEMVKDTDLDADYVMGNMSYDAGGTSFYFVSEDGELVRIAEVGDNVGYIDDDNVKEALSIMNFNAVDLIESGMVHVYGD